MPCTFLNDGMGEGNRKNREYTQPSAPVLSKSTFVIPSRSGNGKPQKPDEVFTGFSIRSLQIFLCYLKYSVCLCFGQIMRKSVVILRSVKRGRPIIIFDFGKDRRCFRRRTRNGTQFLFMRNANANSRSSCYERKKNETNVFFNDNVVQKNIQFCNTTSRQLLINDHDILLK